jgi:anti-sigma regulatory factor (Ser/Thr protein kinase)
MCRVDTATFDPAATAAGAARGFVQACLDRWGIHDSRDSALLLASELVTNAAVHARTRIEVTVAVARSSLEVGVADESPRPPRPRHTPGQDLPTVAAIWLAEGGCGLLIVEALADEWGIAEERGGKRVWFRLAVQEDWPHNTTCPCGGAALHRAVALGSGRRAQHVPGPWDH